MDGGKVPIATPELSDPPAATCTDSSVSLRSENNIKKFENSSTQSFKTKDELKNSDNTCDVISTDAQNDKAQQSPEKKKPPVLPRVDTPESVKIDNRETTISEDIKLFEAWFELMAKNENGKVKVEELVDKVTTSGMFTFNNNASNLLRKMEEKAVKEDLLDLIEGDLSLNVLEWISIDQFIKVIVRFPRYVYRLKRAAGYNCSPPKKWEKVEALPSTKDECDILSDYGDDDPFDLPREDIMVQKQLMRVSWRSRFKGLFDRTTKELKVKKKRNPKRLSKQSSSFFERCRSVRNAFMCKTSTVKVFMVTEGSDDDD